MQWLRQDDGYASVEYALILVTTAIVLVFALTGIIGPASSMFDSFSF